MATSTNDNIIIVGPMGVGKTTVGKLVAESLDREFVDTDSMIEEMTGLSIARIFSERSEAFFRSLEREVVESIKDQSNLIIAAGGGMIVSEENYRDLSASGLLVCLLASVDILTERLRGSNGRPLLHGGKREDTVKSLLYDRLSTFEKIEHKIHTDTLEPSAIAENVVRIYRSRTADV